MSGRLPGQLIRTPARRSWLLREWVKMVGRLAGHWHYHVRRRDAEPRLLANNGMGKREGCGAPLGSVSASGDEDGGAEGQVSTP